MIALKIRFVVFDSSVIFEILEQDNELLGWSGAMEERTINQGRIENVFIRRGKGVYFKHEDLFERLKADLSEFADNNAFYGKDKPIPRLERIPSDGSIYIDAVLLHTQYGQTQITGLDVVALEQLSGNPFQFYETKPKFKSQWTKIFPREFTEKDLPMAIYMLPKEHHAAAKANILSCLNSTETDIEIHEFTMETI